MNDAAIRPLLYLLLRGGIYVDELPTGSTRADVVHITEEFLHGYELKGDNDTLKRVLNQLRCYAGAYDYVTFVVTQKHLAALLAQLPEWVGVSVATEKGIDPVRPANLSTQICRRAVAFLLPLDEIKWFLVQRGEKRIRRLRSWELGDWLAKADHIPLSELAGYVRRLLIDQLPQRLQRRENSKANREEAIAARQQRIDDYKAKLVQYQLDDPAWYAQQQAFLEAELLRL